MNFPFWNAVVSFAIFLSELKCSSESRIKECPAKLARQKSKRSSRTTKDE